MSARSPTARNQVDGLWIKGDAILVATFVKEHHRNLHQIEYGRHHTSHWVPGSILQKGVVEVGQTVCSVAVGLSARRLTHSVHAPADWIFHAKIVAHSWDGLRTRQIAEILGCHPQTVRERLQAFNDRGFDGLGMKVGGGRKPTYEPTGELHVDDPKGEL